MGIRDWFSRKEEQIEAATGYAVVPVNYEPTERGQLWGGPGWSSTKDGSYKVQAVVAEINGRFHRGGELLTPRHGRPVYLEEKSFESLGAAQGNGKWEKEMRERTESTYRKDHATPEGNFIAGDVLLKYFSDATTEAMYFDRPRSVYPHTQEDLRAEAKLGVPGALQKLINDHAKLPSVDQQQIENMALKLRSRAQESGLGEAFKDYESRVSEWQKAQHMGYATEAVAAANNLVDFGHEYKVDVSTVNGERKLWDIAEDYEGSIRRADERSEMLRTQQMFHKHAEPGNTYTGPITRIDDNLIVQQTGEHSYVEHNRVALLDAKNDLQLGRNVDISYPYGKVGIVDDHARKIDAPKMELDHPHRDFSTRQL